MPHELQLQEFIGIAIIVFLIAWAIIYSLWNDYRYSPEHEEERVKKECKKLVKKRSKAIKKYTKILNKRKTKSALNCAKKTKIYGNFVYGRWTCPNCNFEVTPTVIKTQQYIKKRVITLKNKDLKDVLYPCCPRCNRYLIYSEEKTND